MITLQRDVVLGEPVTHDKWILRLKVLGEFSQDRVNHLAGSFKVVSDKYADDEAILRMASGSLKDKLTCDRMRFAVYNISGRERAEVLQKAVVRFCEYFNLNDYKLELKPKPAPTIIKPDVLNVRRIPRHVGRSL